MSYYIVSPFGKGIYSHRSISLDGGFSLCGSEVLECVDLTEELLGRLFATVGRLESGDEMPRWRSPGCRRIASAK